MAAVMCRRGGATRRWPGSDGAAEFHGSNVAPMLSGDVQQHGGVEREVNVGPNWKENKSWWPSLERMKAAAFQSRSNEWRWLQLSGSKQMVLTEVEGLKRLGGPAHVKRESEGGGGFGGFPFVQRGKRGGSEGWGALSGKGVQRSVQHTTGEGGPALAVVDPSRGRRWSTR
jgi:hypothetical protein